MKIKVPPKTKNVPNQWASVKGLSKYTILKTKDKNFLRVITNVTVREEHSVVNT